MPTIKISLPDDMKDWVFAQNASGKYKSASLYIRELIRRDQERLYEDGILKHGLAQAGEYLMSIHHVLSLIAENPRLARLRTEISPPVRAHMLIYYLNDHNKPVILGVKHASEPWIDASPTS